MLGRDSYGLGSVGGTQLPYRRGQVVAHGPFGEEDLSRDRTGGPTPCGCGQHLCFTFGQR